MEDNSISHLMNYPKEQKIEILKDCKGLLLMPIYLKIAIIIMAFLDRKYVKRLNFLL
jgi:hypothetical protein